MQREPRQKLTLEMPRSTMQRMASLQTRMGAANRTEVIRRSLTLMDLLLQIQEDGGKTVVHDKAGIKETLRILA